MLTVTVTDVEADRRYRVLVSLVRSDRPLYWTFHCPNCTRPVAELSNVEVHNLSDLIDMNNQEKSLAGIRCDGRINGQNCRIWYYFNLQGTR